VLGVDCTLHIVFSLKSCADKVLHKERVSACFSDAGILFTCNLLSSLLYGVTSIDLSNIP
jgi:hypothetical protein